MPTLNYYLNALGRCTAFYRAAALQDSDVRVIIRGIEYTVQSVDALRDDTDLLHHYEIGLV